MAKKKLTQQQVQDALIQSHGLKTIAADALGVAFTTIERYILESQTAQDIVKAMRHKRTDQAKAKLDEAIQRGESWAIMFTLKNKIDPDNEFVGERSRIEGAGEGGAIDVNMNMPVEQIAQRITQLLELARQRKNGN